MKIALMTRFVRCLYMAVFASSPVVAASGRMTFSGVVAESTCNTAAVDDMRAQVGLSRTGPDAKRLTCGRGGGAKDISPTVYVLTTVRLSSATRDPALKYFDEYVKADRVDREDPLLLTRTYE